MGTFVALENRTEVLPLSEHDLKVLGWTTGPNFKLKNKQLLDRIAQTAAVADLGGQTPVIGFATLNLNTNPTHQDTVTIGGQVYEFINTGTGTVVANDNNIAVVIGGTAAATVTNFLAAINGIAAAEHATITKADTVTPANGVGTLRLFAFTAGSNVVSLTHSATQGVNPTTAPWEFWANMPAAMPSVALTDALTAAVNWSVSNLNTLLFFNPFQTTRGFVSFRLPVTTALIAVGTARVFCPGVSKTGNPAVVVQGYTSAGVPKNGAADTVVWNSTLGSVDITLAGGGSDWANTDVVHVIVAGAASTAI
jgi:hypothetical protein